MNLKARVFRVLVPTEDVIEIQGGQRRMVTRKIYPGYVLVDMVLDDQTWHAVRNTPGVTGFVGGMGTDPVPLTPEELDYVLPKPAPVAGEEPAAKPTPKIAYEIGQAVQVIDGPFPDFLGPVSEVGPERQKLTVLVSFFGRETPATLECFSVDTM